VSTDAFQLFFDTILQEGITGALVWSLRGRSRDGGFYWHSEPLGGDIYKAYHWPGFATGRGYDEANLMTLMQIKAHQIQAIPVLRLLPPGPPELLPIAHPSAVTWRGSSGATSYRVERAESAKGPWKGIGVDVDESQVQYRPLFADTAVSSGATYFYRVIAENVAGRSKPSNIVGPVEVTHHVLIDEMANYSRSFHHRGKMSFVSQEARKAKEDVHRLRGEKDAFITYRVDLPLKQCRLDSFFPAEVSDFTFLASVDGLSFTPVRAQRTVLPSGDPEYVYWNPVRFEVTQFPADARFVRIVFPSLADVSRFEIRYGR